MTMTEQQMVAIWNEWMRRYIEEPEQFAREFQTVMTFVQEEAEGREPSYGENCLAYWKELAAQGIGAPAS